MLNSAVFMRANNDCFQFAKAPEADVHVATHWSTVEGLMNIDNIRRAYFMQHFEPVMEQEGSLKWSKAFQIYTAPTHKIANSSWCKDTVEGFILSQGLHQSVRLALNAIDGNVFHPAPTSHIKPRKRVISYGGRGVTWKGFLSMAKAVAKARQILGEDSFEWRVYGDAELPPNNSVAHYTPLGFLFPDQLAEEYRRSDILLSASWYESFPLFPLEGMACSLAVISSAKGVEDYAVDQFNCVIVDPHSVSSISQALIELVKDDTLCERIRQNAQSTAQKFTWARASDQMESALKEISLEPPIPDVGRDRFLKAL